MSERFFMKIYENLFIEEFVLMKSLLDSDRYSLFEFESFSPLSIESFIKFLFSFQFLIFSLFTSSLRQSRAAVRHLPTGE